MTASGTFRVYFNRHQAAPLVWCVALEVGDVLLWEIAVASVVLNAPTSTVYAPRANGDDETGLASAYLVTTGKLLVAGSTAVIE